MKEYIRGWISDNFERVNWVVAAWYGFAYCMIVPTILVSFSVSSGQLISFYFGEPLYRVPVGYTFVVYIPLLMAMSMIIGIVAMAFLFSVLKVREHTKRFIRRRSPPFIIEDDYGPYRYSDWVRKTARRQLKITTIFGVILSSGVLILLLVAEEILGYRFPSPELSGLSDLPIVLFPVMGVFTAALPEKGLLNDPVFLIVFGIPVPFFALAARNLMYLKTASFLDAIPEFRENKEKRNIVAVLYLFLTAHAIVVIWVAYMVAQPY